MSRYDIIFNKFFLISKFMKHPDIARLFKKTVIATEFRKIIIIGDEMAVFMNSLIIHVTSITHFHHVILNGLPYYETQNKWNKYCIDDRPIYDDNNICRGDNECEHKPKIYPSKNDIVEYVLGINEAKLIKLNDKNDTIEYRLKINQLEIITQRLLLKKDIDIALSLIPYNINDVLLTGFNYLEFQNMNEIDFHHCGSNHCNVFLKTSNFVCVKNFVTLYDLAAMFYAMKSHKWDTLYERFSHVQTGICNKNIHISLTFAHNS